MIPSDYLTPAILAQIRNAMGLSRKELAEELGVSYLTVRRWEQDDVQIPKIVGIALTEVSFQNILGRLQSFQSSK